MKIQKTVNKQLDDTQYYQQQFIKKQIVLHHTVSNGNAENVISSWSKTAERVGVAFVIDGKGVVYAAFSSFYWAHHLGTHQVDNTKLNQQSIGIEICNWGQLTKKDNKFFNYLNQEISSSDVVTYTTPFRGSCYYQKYNDAQLHSLSELLSYLCSSYFIPKSYNADMWEVSQNALSGKPGIYTHVSFRKDKSDCHPQKELIELLKALK